MSSNRSSSKKAAATGAARDSRQKANAPVSSSRENPTSPKYPIQRPAALPTEDLLAGPETAGSTEKLASRSKSVSSSSSSSASTSSGIAHGKAAPSTGAALSRRSTTASTNVTFFSAQSSPTGGAPGVFHEPDYSGKRVIRSHSEAKPPKAVHSASDDQTDEEEERRRSDPGPRSWPDPNSDRFRALMGFPIGKASASSTDVTGDIPIGMAADPTARSPSPTTSRGTQTSLALSRPGLQVFIPHSGMVVPNDWQQRLKEQMKDYRQMLTDAFVGAKRFHDWRKLSLEKMNKGIFLPESVIELNYRIPHEFAKELGRTLYRRRIVQDYDKFVSLRRGMPQDWPPFDRSDAVMHRGNNVNPGWFAVEARMDAKFGSGQVGADRYADWKDLDEFVPWFMDHIEPEWKQTVDAQMAAGYFESLDDAGLEVMDWILQYW